jgi:alpha 1,3-glucosidase
MPVMRMMWMQYPQTADLFATDDHFLIGSDLLVKPITTKDTTSTQIKFPANDIWYDARTLELVSSKVIEHGVNLMKVPAPMETIPVYQRGGSILARKLRLRRSTVMMKTDPYTLYVALDTSNKATGALYMDDEETFGYERMEFANCTFTADLTNGGSLSNAVTIGSGFNQDPGDRMIERIIVTGVSSPPKKVILQGSELEFSYANNQVVVRKPLVSAIQEWTIGFEN